MKQANTIVSVIVAVVVLLAAFGVGLCIKEIRFRRAGAKSEGPEIQTPRLANALETDRPPARPMPGPGGAGPERGAFQGQRGLSEDERAAMRERFENMSPEEKEQFTAQMRERFGGRRRGGGGGDMFQNLSEEQRAQFREEMEDLRARWEQMSEEEREQARAQMEEKYGFSPRIGMGGGPGGGGPGGGAPGGGAPGGRGRGGRGPGSGEFGGRRPDGQ